MKSIQFKKRFSGKWVLSGEYSVLRSGSALVYPLSQYYIDFKYKETTQSLSLKKSGAYQTGLDFAVTPILRKALKKLDKKKEQLKGSLEIKGQIPFGAGLGASSALCAGISYLFLKKKWLKKNQLIDFAINLENFFHGKSSGMDVTAVLKEQAILYHKGKIVQSLKPFKHKPLLYLSYSGGRSSTSVGVAKVKKLFDKDWGLGEKIDKQMNQSVKLCLQASKETNKNKSLSLLVEAIDLAYHCFEQWGLISYDLEQHIEDLKNQGALAVKPTGSGLGGYVISLWDKKPNIKQGFIPLSV